MLASKISSDTCQQPTTAVAEKTDSFSISMLELVENIVDLAESSQLSEEFYEKAKPFTDILCSRQKVSKVESVILSLLINSVVDFGMTLRDIGNYLECTNIETIRLQPVIKSLMAKRLAQVADSMGETNFVASDELVDAYRDNRPYFPPSIKFDKDEDLLSYVFDMNCQHSVHDMGDKMYAISLRQVFHENESLSIMRHLKELGVKGLGNLAVTLHLCCYLHFDDERDIALQELKDIFPCGPERNHFIHELRRGEGLLFDNKVIEHAMTPDGMVDTDVYRLTDEAVKKLLPGYKRRATGCGLAFSVTSPDKIVKKDLFFSDQVRRQVETLTGLLDDAKLRLVQQRLTDHGLRKGFCCLFYGKPGTGKTALALELARRTGRKLVRVDLSSVRDKYVGESEKNVQEIFDDYKEMLQVEDKTPILLLNEADGLLTRRVNTGLGRSSSVDKMENTMQNILLQNMEDFEGILIATTNLTVNMDKAFERRFLYKIEFTSPDISARRSIWHSLMPNLDSETVMDIATRYEFSGGQIENIARKSLVDAILYGDDDARSKDRVDELCRHENISDASDRRTIGFCA